MNINLAQDWPLYILLGAVAFFFTFAIIKARLSERETKKNNKKAEEKK